MVTIIQNMFLWYSIFITIYTADMSCSFKCNFTHALYWGVIVKEVDEWSSFTFDICGKVAIATTRTVLLTSFAATTATVVIIIWVIFIQSLSTMLCCIRYGTFSFYCVLDITRILTFIKPTVTMTTWAMSVMEIKRFCQQLDCSCTPRGKYDSVFIWRCVKIL